MAYLFPSIIAFIASIRSESESPGAKNGLSKSSTVVGVACPQILHSCSSPNHINFCSTIYSVQSRCLAGAASCASMAVSSTTPRLFVGSLTLPVDWRLVMRRTTWRTPDLGIARSGPDVERAGHRTCSGWGIEAEACPPLANLLGLDKLLLALGLGQHLCLELLGLLNLERL